MIVIINVVDTDDTDKYEIKFINKDFLKDILLLQNIIKKNLTNTKSYYLENAEFFSKQLVNREGAIGLFQKDQLVGFNIASFPGINKDNLGVDVGIRQNELFQVAQFGPVAIHPDHRKKGLLTKIIEKHVNSIRKNGYKHICLTIAPGNYPSIRATTSYGFIIKKIKKKYRNSLRYILHLDLANRVKYPKYSVRIPNTDLESQKFMLDLGFYGYDVIKSDSGFDLIFGYDEIKA